MKEDMFCSQPISKSYNKQFEPTVMPQHVRAASAPFHYALAARWTAQRAAAQLRRYAAGLNAARRLRSTVFVLA
jgi:hypothetical protein